MTKRLGVLTSGGDAQGMNAAIRATVRAALDQGAEVYGIYEGYQGMIDGGDFIHQVGWNVGGGILHKGGTVFGTARSPEFRTREGRRKAVANLLRHGIDRLVIIGGDGSLTGANILRQEWRELVEELVAAGEIDQATADAHPYLTIAGLVGSIDNDMYGTDMTIGADSALHRITDAIDAITSTAASHQRAFVVEVMGRNCGYLALMSSILGGAEIVVTPHRSFTLEVVAMSLEHGYVRGMSHVIAVVAECAPYHITTLQDFLKQQSSVGFEIRVTILGHIQRGGSPTAFDRLLATRMGVKSVQALIAGETGKMVALNGRKMDLIPIEEAISQIRPISESYFEMARFLSR